MPRYYVENPNKKWNIYSTIIDDLLFEDWVEFADLEKFVCDEVADMKRMEVQTLLTEQPVLNTMNYEDCMVRLKDSDVDEYE